MVTMTVTVDENSFGSAVGSLIQSATNLRPMMTIAGGIFENSTRNRFDREAGPGGVPWPQSYRAREQGGKTLTDKGLLRGSIRSNVGDTFVETGVDARNQSAKYARSHQFGVTIRPVNAPKLVFTGSDGRLRAVDQVTLPARPFLGIDQEDTEDLREAFVFYLTEAVESGNRPG